MLVIGHRGAPREAPENSLPGIAAALAAGADGVEVDVRLSADGVCVLSHDRTLRRVADLDVPVAFASWAELSLAQAAGVRAAPRLEEVLDSVPPSRRLVIEVKRGDEPPGATGRAVGRLLRSTPRPDRDVVVSSFHEGSLRAVRETCGPGVRTALLTRPGVGARRGLVRAVRAGCAEMHPHVRRLVDQLDVVGEAHARGLRVVAWTCDDPIAQCRLAAARVDGVICDDPRAAVGVVHPGSAILPPVNASLPRRNRFRSPGAPGSFTTAAYGLGHG